MSRSHQRRKRGSLRPRVRKNTKITGERSEADFLDRAIHYGFGVAKPWGDSLRYDFILDNGVRLIRIQVKCTECLRADAYETRATYTVGKGRAVYTKDDVDFIAVHVVPLNIWYIIPVEVCQPAPMLRVYPHRKAKHMRLEQYREAWHLLDPPYPRPTSGLEIQASIEQSGEEEHVGTAAPGCPAGQNPASDADDHGHVVIPSGVSAASSAALAKSRDPVFPLPPNLTWLTPRPPSRAADTRL